MPALRKAVCQAVSVKSSAIGLDRKQNPMLPGLGFEYGDGIAVSGGAARRSILHPVQPRSFARDIVSCGARRWKHSPCQLDQRVKRSVAPFR